MGKRIFLSLLICLICNVCCIYQVNADASSCTADTEKENCKCPGWGFSETTGCTECEPRTYNDGTTGDVTQCKSCANKIPEGAEQTDYTKETCPWKLTCSAGTYYDEEAMKCTPCPDNEYASGDKTIQSDGIQIIGRQSCTKCPDNSVPNGDHTDFVCNTGYRKSDDSCIKDCNKGQYRSGDNCIACPTGSTTTDNNATLISQCYMDSTTTKFYTADGKEIPFTKVFGDDITIHYTINN